MGDKPSDQQPVQVGSPEFDGLPEFQSIDHAVEALYSAEAVFAGTRSSIQEDADQSITEHFARMPRKERRLAKVHHKNINGFMIEASASAVLDAANDIKGIEGDCYGFLLEKAITKITSHTPEEVFERMANMRIAHRKPIFVNETKDIEERFAEGVDITLAPYDVISGRMTELQSAARDYLVTGVAVVDMLVEELADTTKFDKLVAETLQNPGNSGDNYRMRRVLSSILSGEWGEDQQQALEDVFGYHQSRVGDPDNLQLKREYIDGMQERDTGFAQGIVFILGSTASSEAELEQLITKTLNNTTWPEPALNDFEQFRKSKLDELLRVKRITSNTENIVGIDSFEEQTFRQSVSRSYQLTKQAKRRHHGNGSRNDSQSSNIDTKEKAPTPPKRLAWGTRQTVNSTTVTVSEMSDQVAKEEVSNRCNGEGADQAIISRALDYIRQGGVAASSLVGVTKLERSKVFSDGENNLGYAFRFSGSRAPDFPERDFRLIFFDSGDTITITYAGVNYGDYKRVLASYV